jgi:hypothetical protein
VGLAESLRRWNEHDLAVLLTVRPELGAPAPRSIDEIVARATAPYAVHSAVGRLDRAALQVLAGVALAGGETTLVAVAALAQEPPPLDELDAVVERLRLHALVERVDGRIIAIPAVLRTLGPPLGLRQPLSSALDRLTKQDLTELASTLGVPIVAGKVGQLRLVVDDLRAPGRIERLLHEAGEGAFDVIAAIDRAGGMVPIATHRFVRSQLPPPVRRLLETGLLVPYGNDLVELPREVALVVRGGAPLTRFMLSPPQVTAAGREERALLAGLTTLSPVEVTDRVSAIVVRLAEQPLQGLRNGGVPVKEVRAMARELHVADPDAARLLELAHAAGLIAGSFVGPVQVTAEGRAWLERPAARRWVQLVRAWALSGIEVWRAGTRDHHDKPVPPLADPLGGPASVRRRARLLRRWADAATRLDAPPSILAVVANGEFEGGEDWSPGEEPMDPAERVTGTLAMASLLGLLAGGLPTPGLGVLLGGADEDELVSHAAGLFPPAVSTFTVQADLTAIAPSELDPPVAGELALLADPVSRSAVSVLRFTDASLRRAFDRGRTVEGILAFLDAHARPAVPQALRVLVTDVGRRHGRVRIGAAQSYLRTDDPALLAEITRHRKLAKLDVRVIAPTVAVTGEPPRKLMTTLRDAGFLPAPDGEGIDVVVEATSDRMLRIPARARDAAATWQEGVATADGRATAMSPSRAALATAELLVRSRGR